MIDFSKYKTIRQIADEIGVSTQAIHKKINKSMQIELNPHIKIVNRQKLIDEQGVKLIKNGCQPTTTQENELSTMLENTNETPNFTEKTGYQPTPDEMTINYINSLKEQISILTADKEYGRAQIADLHEELKKQSERIADLADKLVELTRNSQVLLKQEQGKTAFLLPEQQTKRPFWQFWKK